MPIYKYGYHWWLIRLTHFYILLPLPKVKEVVLFCTIFWGHALSVTKSHFLEKAQCLISVWAINPGCSWSLQFAALPVKLFRPSAEIRVECYVCTFHWLWKLINHVGIMFGSAHSHTTLEGHLFKSRGETPNYLTLHDQFANSHFEVFFIG